MKSDWIVKISALAYGGSGVGRLQDGRVCFVPGTLPGETAEIRITAAKKRFVSAQVLRLIEVSEKRVVPECPLYGQCPGCVYMHCDYGTEFFWKEKQLKDFLLRSGVAEAGAFTAGVPSPQREFYRNKLTLHRGEGKSGYCGFDNRTVIPVEQCRLADRRINELLPLEGDVLLRCTAVDGAKVIGPGTAGILHEEISGFGKFAVAGNGFFQVNIPVAAELVKRVLAVMKSSGVRELLELYCGIGLFSIVLAENMPELHCCGIELNKEAVKFARINAKEHHVGDRCRFFAGDAGKGLRKMGKHSGEFAVLLDPPRTGVEKETLKMIGSSGAAQIIYISCAADTLTRDLKELTAAGYKVESFQALDMFPCTAHFETLSLLSFHGKRK